MKNHKLLQTLFTLSIILKCIDGFFELIGGLVFVILDKEIILNMFSNILHYDLLKIPNHLILKWVTRASEILTTHVKLFISLILIGNGAIKIFISINLLMKKLWAFPVALAFLFVLFVYQVSQSFYFNSFFLNLFNVFDAIVILVIFREYLYLRTKKKRN